MLPPNDTFDILLAKLRALECALDALRDEVADLRARLDGYDEGWLGGND
jgi:hypothetical protein